VLCPQCVRMSERVIAAAVAASRKRKTEVLLMREMLPPKSDLQKTASITMRGEEELGEG
jgi:hypothetical protein